MCSVVFPEDWSINIVVFKNPQKIVFIIGCENAEYFKALAYASYEELSLGESGVGSLATVDCVVVDVSRCYVVGMPFIRGEVVEVQAASCEVHAVDFIEKGH